MQGNAKRPNVPQEIPFEITEAAELYARRSGRHARVFWHPALRCPVIELGCIEGDPRLVAWQEGRVRNKPVELVVLHRQNPTTLHYEAIDLGDLGAAGLTELLEQADLLSGRGEHSSLYEAVQKVDTHNEKVRQGQIAAVEEAAKETAWLHRRRIEGVPFVGYTPPERDGSN